MHRFLQFNNVYHGELVPSTGDYLNKDGLKISVDSYSDDDESADSLTDYSFLDGLVDKAFWSIQRPLHIEEIVTSEPFAEAANAFFRENGHDNIF